MLYRAFCLLFGTWRYYIGLIVLMYAQERFALLLYGTIEAMTGMAAMWNACLAKRIDHRYTGFVLPILYSVGYWVVPVPSESFVADSALMVVAVLRLWVIGYLGLRMSLGLAT